MVQHGTGGGDLSPHVEEPLIRPNIKNSQHLLLFYGDFFLKISLHRLRTAIYRQTFDAVHAFAIHWIYATTL